MLSDRAGETYQLARSHTERVADLPEIPKARLLLNEQAISWDAWSDYWEQCQSGAPPSQPLLDNVKLLPSTRPEPEMHKS